MKKITKNILSFALLLTVFGLPLVAGAQFDPTAGSSGTGLSTDSLDSTLTNILNIFLALIALLTVLGFVVAGIMFITAGGNDARLGQAKSWLMYSIIGLVVALVGYIVVNFIDTLLT